MDTWMYIAIGDIFIGLGLWIIGMRLVNNYKIPAIDMFPRKENPYRLLVLFPHPDDESFAAGGTIARYASKDNVEVRVVCFTRGEAGEFNGEEDHGLDLGTIRTKEFANSMKQLGIENHELKNLPDGKLSQTKALREKVEKTIREFHPTTVITYEEGGMYNHSDHVALTTTLLDVYHRNKQYELYLSTIPKKLESKFNFKIKNEPNISVKVWRQKLKKLRAFKAHKSQYNGFSFTRKIIFLVFILLHTREYYYKVPK